MIRQDIAAERVFYFANSLLASLQISFLKPLHGIPAETITEQELQNRFGKDKGSIEAAAWIRQRLETFSPTLIVFCRYSAVHAKDIVLWARHEGVPTIFHIDDDLLSVPAATGSSKSAHHNEPTRLATIRYLLDETTLVYCSTAALRERLFGNEPNLRVVHGDIYCAHEVMAPARSESQHSIIGYMGTGSHAEDFQLASSSIQKLLAKYPQTKLEIFGAVPMPSEFGQFGFRVQSISPVSDYSEFMRRLASLDWTVGLCPLAKTPFNAVKANTKWVEYTAAGFPVVASRGTVYDDCCSDGCGILVDGEAEWLDAVNGLLVDPLRRQTMTLRAQKRLQQDYSPEALVQQIASIFEKAHDLQNNSAPPSKRDAPAVAPILGTSEVPTISFSSDQAIEKGEARDRGEVTGDIMYFDQLMGDHIQGWAWSPNESSHKASEVRRVELRCGNISLGYCTRTIHRADVDEHLDDRRGKKGFSLPGLNLNIFWRLLRQNPGLLPTAVFGSKSLPLDGVTFQDRSAFTALRRSRDDDSWQIADIWWGNSRLLKLRTKYDSGPPARATLNFTRLRIYQPIESDEGQLELRQVDEIETDSKKAAVIAIGVVSPIMPLLLVGCDDENEIAFTDLVPFPSLLRGGFHESEVAALGSAGGTLEDLVELSNSYVIETIECDSGEYAVGQICIDLTSATGAEPIFDPAVAFWLTHGLGIPLRCDVAGTSFADLDGALSSYAAEHFARYEPSYPRGGRGRLILPAGAIPTIASVVSRRLCVPAERQPGAHIVVEAATSKRRWLLTYPGVTSSQHNIFVRYAANHAPVLTAIEDSNFDSPAPGVPLAILYRDIGGARPVEKLFPVPKDKPKIILQDKASAHLISIILFLRNPEDANEAVLASIAGQNTTADCEIVVVINKRNNYGLQQLRRRIDELTPAHFKIVDIEDAVNRSAALNRAAVVAAGDAFLVVDSSVVLHDYRTAETLAALAMCDGVGTVGCMLLQQSPPAYSPPAFKSAGYFPGRVDFSVAPHLALTEYDCSDILPNAIYPVAANSSFCFAIASDRWKEVGGLDDKHFRDLHAEIDLAARLVVAGKINLCTTLLSAYIGDPPARKRLCDVDSVARLDFWRLAEAMKASTTIRTL
jgi:glycosyltransferase involved in cell wall biosynthesis/GT2 family glycosyltransferase